VQGTRGDFDHGVFGHEAERAWHTELSASYGRSCFTRGLARRLHLFQVTGTRPALAARSGARVLYSTVSQVPLRSSPSPMVLFRATFLPSLRDLMQDASSLGPARAPQGSRLQLNRTYRTVKHGVPSCPARPAEPKPEPRVLCGQPFWRATDRLA
jgi:hypothetical protein